MKLNKNLKKLIIPAIGGLLLTAYLLYTMNGTFGTFEAIVVAVTAIVILGLLLIINRIAPKNE